MFVKAISIQNILHSTSSGYLEDVLVEGFKW